MNNQTSSGDAMHPKDGQHASVAAAALLSDVMHARGRFHVTHLGPVESQRGRYIELRDALAVMDTWSLPQRTLTAFKRRAMHRELAAIPLERKSPDDTFPNVVTTVGKNDMEDKYLAGSAYTATPRMGLKGTGTAVIGDTQASHASWLEQGLANAPTYTGNRPSPSFSAASGGVKSTSAAVSFAITSTGTVFGCFINNGGSATKDDTTGVLFSAGDFTGGSKAVANADTLNVTYSLTLT